MRASLHGGIADSTAGRFLRCKPAFRYGRLQAACLCAALTGMIESLLRHRCDVGEVQTVPQHVQVPLLSDCLPSQELHSSLCQM